MMALHARSRRCSSLALIVIFVTVVVYLVKSAALVPRAEQTHYARSPVNKTSINPMQPPEDVVGFWRELVRTMKQHEPVMPAIEIQGGQPAEYEMVFKGTKTQRANRVTVAGNNLVRLEITHTQFVNRVKQLSRQMPFARGAKGIVMTATGDQVGQAITSILMLRRTGSQLPVQLFLFSEEDFKKNEAICQGVFPALKTECWVMDKILESSPEEIDLEHYQLRIFAILFSTFQEVLFLAHDTWPVHNPDRLFGTQPYKLHGMVTWPDNWLSTTAREFYDIAAVPVPDVLERRSADPSIVMCNKASHARSIMLAAYYNVFGPRIYYPLLQQGAATVIDKAEHSDRDTLTNAAIAMEEKFYDVKTNVAQGGRRLNGEYLAVMNKQADPWEDYRLFGDGKSGAAKEARKDLRNLGADGREMRARTLFIRHDGVKLDVKRPLRALSALFDVDQQDGRHARLWGPESELNLEAGFDVEKGLWEEFIDADCASTFLSHECEQLERYLVDVFYTV
ncbi:uncharacterized protein E0L32_004283 [Thyridium curvatum]|uniref:Alpha-1,2-mannosyltransferase n=1 Tax=Thyridium curvatum TaxID=1093900 RepID=A0A507AXS7_9PEZI|nr:uncharacterized protein E0L32_004283 [Thyridium curvatum]TPX15585.1 hypothetical protein E0L32_004283 [Thyridium curvatum]